LILGRDSSRSEAKLTAWELLGEIGGEAMWELWKRRRAEKEKQWRELQLWDLDATRKAKERRLAEEARMEHLIEDAKDGVLDDHQDEERWEKRHGKKS